MEQIWRLARRLGGGEFVSGQALATEFGLTRGAIWNMVRALEDKGLAIQAVRGRGYRLPNAVEWFSESDIHAAIPHQWRGFIDQLELQSETDSTNARLVGRNTSPGRACACVAEYQTRGRGRRGRRWLMPPAAGICLSVAWQFERPPAALSALGPAAGLAVRRGLCDLGIDGVGLKWPNDLVWRNAKLGGILVELRAEGQGPAFVVIGVGVNDQLDAELRRAIVDSGGQSPVDLATIRGADRPGRNRVAGAIIGRLLELLSCCADAGVDQMCRDWAEADVLLGREVRVSLGDSEVTGVARGLAADGALLLDTTDGSRRLTAGDVRVRLQV